MTYYKYILRLMLIISYSSFCHAEIATPSKYLFNNIQNAITKIFTPAKNVRSEAEELLEQATQKIDNSLLNTQQQLIIVSIDKQKLYLFDNNKKLNTHYVISTSKYGPGQSLGTKATPLGLHYVNEKIGHNVPIGGVFKNRKYVGKTWHQIVPRYTHYRRDFIVTRILRLQGLEKGFNSGINSHGVNVDSQDRGIYIHGTTMEWKIGKPSTIGCIHMKNSDIIKLFYKVDVGALVVIL